MPLGLAKDSMINLAELAHQRDDDDDSSEIKLEDGEEETLVMHLLTHEIEALDETFRTEESKKDILTAEEAKDCRDEGKILSAPETIGDGDSLRSGAALQLGTRSAESSEREAQSAESQSSGGTATSYGNYTGFATDYGEYDHYGQYSTYGTLDLFKKQDQPFWCCLFPWAKHFEQGEGMDGNSSTVEDEPGQESMVDVQENGHNGPLSRTTSKDDDDEVSTGSDILGERLSDKDRQAVLARLRLAQPDAKGAASPTSEGLSTDAPIVIKKGLLNDIVTSEVRGPSLSARSILKRASTLSGNNLKDVSGSNSVDGKGHARRSLFPSYETSSKPKKNLNLDFSPMARVLTVKCHKDMDEKEKGEIWWQRSDYEEFRKTGRMITKAMLEGGSEIWLATNQSWQLPNKDKQSTLTNAFSLAEQHAKFQKGDISAKTKYEETRDKWWHKFGHSRRGLEHIASIDEGKQRQNNVRTALRAVIEEQRRQKLFHREDSEKLRMVSIQHTSWARDLALASGASDADAVQANFDDESRKSREFYLLKFSRSNQMKVHSTQKASVPAFMKPALAIHVQANLLDANTVPQIRYRQTQNRRRGTVAPAPTEKPKVKAEPLKTNEDEKPSSSMAKQAAGFASGEEVGNMSHVLTGMGATGIPA
jgi:hypothetical protein